MVLASAALVLAACMTLLIGIARSSLPVVYLAVATSVFAGIMVAVSVVRHRAAAVDCKVAVPDDEGTRSLPP